MEQVGAMLRALNPEPDRFLSRCRPQRNVFGHDAGIGIAKLTEAGRHTPPRTVRMVQRLMHRHVVGKPSRRLLERGVGYDRAKASPESFRIGESDDLPNHFLGLASNAICQPDRLAEAEDGKENASSDAHALAALGG